MPESVNDWAPTPSPAGQLFHADPQHFLANQEKVIKQLLVTVGSIFLGITEALPPISEASAGLTVPLYALVRNLNEIIDKIIGTFGEEGLADLGLFAYLQITLYENMCAVSGVVPYEEVKKRLVNPVNSPLPPEKLISAYLQNTPFVELFSTRVPFHIPEEKRFLGHWICAPSGKGKTTLLYSMLLEDFEKDACIIIMDSKGELINEVSKWSTIKDRLVLIEPSAELQLNPFGISSGVHTVEMLQYLLSTLLQTEMTPKQGTLFAYALEAALTMPKPTMRTFRDIIKNGMAKTNALSEDVQEFFAHEFGTKLYSETRQEIQWRLRGLMRSPIVRGMFGAEETLLDIPALMNSNSIVVINNSKDLLGEAGCEFFGRFFLAVIYGEALQRTKQTTKHPVYVYIDEAQVVIKRDEKVQSIIDECRSQKIALILSHQRYDQLTEPVRKAVANCGIRMANSDDEAAELAPKLRTTADALRSLPQGIFATVVRDYGAFNLKVALPTLPPHISAAEQQALKEEMRRRYCKHTATPSNIAEHAGIYSVEQSTDPTKEW